MPPLLVLLVLGRAARGLLALAEDLLEVADLGEEHVAGGPPRLAVGSDVLGPEEIGDELVGHGLERLEVEQVLGLHSLGRGLARVAQDDLPRLLPAVVKLRPWRTTPKSSSSLGLELELLHRRDPDVVRGLSSW